jgi:hypothetical protein
MRAAYEVTAISKNWEVIIGKYPTQDPVLILFNYNFNFFFRVNSHLGSRWIFV